ncbi:hypothetical protein [Pseudomonas sp.]|uniref:hypothetical protein n=1 Tax=Pseudomonas sp. TaxID=306 RepID=UPI003FD88E30
MRIIAAVFVKKQRKPLQLLQANRGCFYQLQRISRESADKHQEAFARMKVELRAKDGVSDISHRVGNLLRPTQVSLIGEACAESQCLRKSPRLRRRFCSYTFSRLKAAVDNRFVSR